MNTLPFLNFLIEWGVHAMVARTHEAGTKLCGTGSSVTQEARLDSFKVIGCVQIVYFLPFIFK